MGDTANNTIIQSTRTCNKCDKAKNVSYFYYKTANRLDTVCKECRKNKRVSRYSADKKKHIEKINKKNANTSTHVSPNEASPVPLDFSVEEFRNIVDAFLILLKIDCRNKNEVG